MLLLVGGDAGVRREAQVEMGKGRRVIVACVLRIHRDNPGGDPSTMRAKRPPNSRDGARCDTAFQNCSSSGLILESFDAGALGSGKFGVVWSNP